MITLVNGCLGCFQGFIYFTIYNERSFISVFYDYYAYMSPPIRVWDPVIRANESTQNSLLICTMSPPFIYTEIVA